MLFHSRNDVLKKKFNISEKNGTENKLHWWHYFQDSVAKGYNFKLKSHIQKLIIFYYKK